MTRNQELINLKGLYKEETGIQEVDLKEFAKWLKIKKGWKMPIPPDPIDLLARQIADALREETRRDATTGLPYKVNIAFSPDGTGQGTLWVDVDEAKRPVVYKCLVQRRDQMSGDAYHLTLIQDHWNNIHPDEDPIQLPLDFGPDVEWRKNGGDEQSEIA